MSTLRQENKTIYWAWKSMKQRCLNPKCKAFRNYGARGITICDAWMDFEPFCDWALNSGYSHGLELDRKDNDGGYSPENCRWITRRENLNNRRKTIILSANGIQKPRTEWEQQLGLPHGILKAWVENHGTEYASMRLEEIIASGYVRKDYGFSHRKAVVHVETGTVYKSTKEAAKALGIASCTIAQAIRTNRSTTKGFFQWERID